MLAISGRNDSTSSLRSWAPPRCAARTRRTSASTDASRGGRLRLDAPRWSARGPRSLLGISLSCHCRELSTAIAWRFFPLVRHPTLGPLHIRSGANPTSALRVRRRRRSTPNDPAVQRMRRVSAYRYRRPSRISGGPCHDRGRPSARIEPGRRRAREPTEMYGHQGRGARRRDASDSVPSDATCRRGG